MSEKEKPSILSKRMAEITDVIGSILTKINVFSGIISTVSSIVGSFGDFVSDVINNAPHAIAHGVNTRQNSRTFHMDKAQYQNVRI